MADLVEEIKRRRTFAIISHPDAGKTTLTEKFLLYGGAIAQAGAVKGKKNSRHAVSDWMEIEKQRGISVTSSVMQFQYGGACINILDTPGHQDFSEDTYRTLMAADSAVMVIDASKGVENQTRKLFKVCAMRNIPIFTFINKLDREARNPFDLIEEIEQELGMPTCPINWPIGSGKDFKVEGGASGPTLYSSDMTQAVGMGYELTNGVYRGMQIISGTQECRFLSPLEYDTTKYPASSVTYEWSYDSSTNTVFQKIRYNGYVYPKD